MNKLQSGLFLGVLVLFGHAHPAQAQQRSDVTIKVASYGGAFDILETKYVVSVLTARIGVKVEFIDANADDHLAKLIASKGREPPYDVTYLDDSVQAKAIAAGVLGKMNDTEVPNLKYVYDEGKDQGGYGPAMDFYSCGFVYNVQKFKEAGISAPDSWADLWNAALAGRVAIPTLNTTMGQCFLAAAEHLAGGDESTPDKGIAKIAQIKAQSFPGSSSTITTLLTSGSAWAIPWLNGRSWALIDQGLPFAYVLPKEGGYRGMTKIDVVAGSKHREEALAYINEVLGPLSQLGMVFEFPYGPTNKLLAPILAAYPDISKKFPASPADLNRLRPINWPVFNKMLPRAVDMWNRQVTSR
jgi:putative spermidine/putrescine transport system substrate-binding protein